VPDWIPEPLVILVGCQAWPPPPLPDGSCPVCGWGIHRGDDTFHCAVCDSSSPRVEAKVRAAQLGLKARDKGQVAEKHVTDQLHRAPVVLTENERRRLWNGYRDSFARESSDVTNLAKVGREFLLGIGQEPDWSLILDKHGRVTGRHPAGNDDA